MDQDIKREWLADLRDGTRVQGYGCLRAVSNPETETFEVVSEKSAIVPRRFKQCCLDVLCEQAVRKGIIPEPLLQSSGTYYYENEEHLSGRETGVLPTKVAEWAGLNVFDPVVEYEDGYGERTLSLSGLNDQLKLNFLQIADVIEEQL